MNNAERLLRLGLVILDELGSLLSSPSGGAPLFHLLSKLCERTRFAITTHHGFSAWAVFGDAKMTTALLDRLAHDCHIPETGNDSFRLWASVAAAKTRKVKTTGLTHTPHRGAWLSPGSLLSGNRHRDVSV